MFISDSEYLLAGTDLGYISAKKTGGVWELSLPPAHKKHVHELEPPQRCIACEAEQYLDVVDDLNNGVLTPFEITPVPFHGNIQNAAGTMTRARVIRQAKEKEKQKRIKEKGKPVDVGNRKRIY